MNAEFERLAGAVLDISAPQGGPETDAEAWRNRVQRLHRLIYRAGVEARLDHESSRLDDDALARVRWLAARGYVNSDVAALADEVEDWREKGQALNSTYGVTAGELRSMVAEGFHTAFRKASDHPFSVVIHHLIRELPPEDWKAVVSFVADPILCQLRDAQAREESKTS